MFRKSILIAGEANLWGLLAHSFFAREGFALLRVGEAATVLGMVEEHDPALVILDLGLAGMGCCCLQIKQDPFLRLTPVLVIDPGGLEESADCRSVADDALPKQVAREVLLAAACRLLGIVDRGGVRLPVELPARVGKEEKKLHPGRVLDLAVGGGYFASSRLYPVDSTVSVEFVLPGGVAIACRGRVAWVNHPEWVKKPSLPTGLGIQFMLMPEVQKKVLTDFVEERGK